jgi:CHAT domain-containing protein
VSCRDASCQQRSRTADGDFRCNASRNTDRPQMIGKTPVLVRAFASVIMMVSANVILLRGPALAQDAQLDATERARLAAQGRTLTDEGTVSALRQAQVVLRRALVDWPDAEDTNGKALALHDFGRCLDAFGRREDALKSYRAAIQLWKSIHNDRDLAAGMSSMAQTLEETGQYSLAFSTLQEALELRRGDNIGEAATLEVIGVTFTDIGDHDSAITQYTRALTISKAIGSRLYEATSHSNIGFSLLLKGDAKGAISSLRLSSDIFADIHFRRGQVFALNNLGRAYESIGDLTKAEHYYQLAIASGKDVADFKIHCIILNNLGRIMIAERKRPKALQYLHEALALSRSSTTREVEARILSSLMTAWSSQNDSVAIFFGKQAVNVYQELRAIIQGADKTLDRTFLKSRADTYRELADLLIKQGRIGEAEQVINLLKDDEYDQFIRSGSDGGRTKGIGLSATEEAWRRRYNDIGDRVTEISVRYERLYANSDRTPTEEIEFRQAFDDLGVANRQFQSVLSNIGKQLGRSAATDERLFTIEQQQTLGRVLPSLGGNVVALYTIVLPEKYVVIVITPSVEVAREYRIRAPRLYALVGAFRDALRDATKDPRAIGKQLYDILVGPIEKDLRGAGADTLMWSLDGALRYLPPNALFDGSHFLLERFTSVIFTPASRDNLKDEPVSQWQAVGMGVSEAEPGFQPLQHVPEELKSIVRDPSRIDFRTGLFEGHVLLDNGFTENAMLAELRRNYQLVHIASHFDFKAADPDSSVLLLGNHSTLTVADVKTMPNIFRNVEMLTLSACDTAQGGRGADGREVEGFGVLAQLQGAKTVVSTLWSVADASTMILMKRFYALESSSPRPTKAAALHRAQLEMFRGSLTASDGTVFQHPYFWAPFIMLGNFK